MSSSSAPFLSLALLLCALQPAAAWVASPAALRPASHASRTCDGHVSSNSKPWRPAALKARFPHTSLTRSVTAFSMSSSDAPEGGGQSKGGEEQVVVGGGCFWCTEAVFLAAPGILRAVSGYAGGATEKPSYRQVVSGKTGHAECVQLTFDPSQISLAQVLDLHMASHDPTQLNRQGVDVGTQYRSIILYSSEQQRTEALAAVARAQEEKGSRKFLGLIPYQSEVVTQVQPLDRFWPAESYHQDYYAKNPMDRYSVVNIGPKLRSSSVRAKIRDIEAQASEAQ